MLAAAMAAVDHPLASSTKVSSTVPALDSTLILAATADILRLYTDGLERPDIPQ
jgi:hypothetical protein